MPSSSLRTSEDIEEQIEYLLQRMNPVELIQFSSFLNMICQSYGMEMNIIRGITLLHEIQLVAPGIDLSNRIVFHRENLLKLIGQILCKDMNGTEKLTGRGHLKNQQKHAQAILLNNDLLNDEIRNSTMSGHEIILKDHFIREWPLSYISHISKTIYGHRIVRYRYCYKDILPLLKDTDRRMMQVAIRVFEETTGISLGQYMDVISGLFCWFLEWPLKREKKPSASTDPKFGFDFMNIGSFYINSKSFEKDSSFIKTIDILSKDIVALKTAYRREQERERDGISGYNKHVRIFFDNPIFKISDGYYCIIDLKFLLENVCGGLLWRLRTQENLQNFKSAYGRLMEEYFKFLIQNIFKSAKVSLGENTGADAIVEEGDKVFVFEFTTEYYRMSSLYNNSSQGFLDDAYRLLFNTGVTDPRGRKKDDKGKLLKLNEYVGQAKQHGKKVIPILVTENLFGNPDFFNMFSNFYNNEVSEKGLYNLQQSLPIFLCLDDLEIFWGLYGPNDAVEGFLCFAEEWTTIDKGPCFHNASVAICELVEKQRGGDTSIINRDFAQFFSPRQIYG